MLASNVDTGCELNSMTDAVEGDEGSCSLDFAGDSSSNIGYVKFGAGSTPGSLSSLKADG